MAVQELLSDPTSVGVWQAVPDRSTIGFKSKSFWGLASVTGKFTEFSADGQITDTPSVFGRIDIKTASLDTKNEKRDHHLCAPDFFDVAKFPDISIVVTGADAVYGDIADLRAQLTVKSTTAPVILRTKVLLLDDGALRVSTKATINRTDFGVSRNLAGVVASKATILGDVVFRRG